MGQRQARHHSFVVTSTLTIAFEQPQLLAPLSIAPRLPISKPLRAILWYPEQPCLHLMRVKAWCGVPMFIVRHIKLFHCTPSKGLDIRS